MAVDVNGSCDRRADRWSRKTAALQLFRLTTDLRVELFAVIFALGMIHHELQFLLEQQLSGPLTSYMERATLVRPTIGWSSGLAIALHLAGVAISLLVLVLPYRRALLCLLALAFLPSQLVSPERTPSHNSLVVFSLAIILVLGLAEAVERARHPGREVRHSTDWYGWTLSGLLWMCSLTYFFAGFHKLNTQFFSPTKSPVLEFVLPYTALLGLPPNAAAALLGFPMIVATVATELCLPLLLLSRPTRVFGILLGVLFHLAMMGQGVMDFPVLILAFYPLFMSTSEARELLARCLERPSIAHLVLVAVCTGLGIVTIRGAAQTLLLHTSDPTSALAVVHGAVSYTTFMLFVHVALTVAGMLFGRQVRTDPVPVLG